MNASARAASPRPAPYLRRYVAWSLDATAIASIAWLLQRNALAAAAAAFRDAYAALAARAGASVFEALLGSVPPMELATRWLGDPAMTAAMRALSSACTQWLLAALPAFALVGLAVHGLCEGSAWQATPGKRALDLRVVSVDAARVGVVRALLRQAAGALSWLTLNLGHALALAPPQYRTLHDRLAGTQVVQTRGDAHLPLWAKAWLALQAVVVLYALVRWHGFTRDAMQAAIDRVLSA